MTGWFFDRLLVTRFVRFARPCIREAHSLVTIVPVPATICMFINAQTWKSRAHRIYTASRLASWWRYFRQ